MGKKPRDKMPVSQRAKQFAPFEAVGGLDEALRRAEEEHRRELEASLETDFSSTDFGDTDFSDMDFRGTDLNGLENKMLYKED